MPKSKSASTQRHDPLYKSIEEGSGHLRSEAKARTKRQHKKDMSDQDEAYVDPATTKKILDIAREQQDEIEAEERQQALKDALKHGFRDNQGSAEIEEFEVNDDDDEDRANWSDNEQDAEDYDDINWDDVPEDADPEDLEVFGRYVEEQNAQTNWADKIMARVNELQTYGRTSFDDEDDVDMAAEGQMEPEGVMLPPKVIQVYTQVGALLSRYRSGKLPRAFKIIPTLKNWRDVLYVTDPSQWSNQAIYEATKLFVASMPTHQVHRYIREILLPKFRDQIQEEKAVNYHVYRALKKALFKPQAFFKGLMFPLLSEMEPTNREAVILGSVLSKTSIPVLHSAAALLFVSEMPYSTANTIIIKVLLDKKYALPYKVVDALVFHFSRFRTHQDLLPLVWHQSLLTFCQRYKNDITEDQRDTLMAVVRIHPHDGITPEIRRELLAGEPRSS